MHGAKDKVIALVSNIRAALSYVKVCAEQLPAPNRWQSFINYVIARFIPPPIFRQRQIASESVG
jgi:hypothetical protein